MQAGVLACCPKLPCSALCEECAAYGIKCQYYVLSHRNCRSEFYCSAALHVMVIMSAWVPSATLCEVDFFLCDSPLPVLLAQVRNLRESAPLRRLIAVFCSVTLSTELLCDQGQQGSPLRHWPAHGLHAVLCIISPRLPSWSRPVYFLMDFFFSLMLHFFPFPQLRSD